jgi:hypothetical protein
VHIILAKLDNSRCLPTGALAKVGATGARKKIRKWIVQLLVLSFKRGVTSVFFKIKLPRDGPIYFLILHKELIFVKKKVRDVEAI